MVHKLWILDPKIKMSPPFQTTNLWSEFQTWFSNSMILRSCLLCFKDSKKPPHMEAPESWGWFYPQCAVLSMGMKLSISITQGQNMNFSLLIIFQESIMQLEGFLKHPQLFVAAMDFPKIVLSLENLIRRKKLVTPGKNWRFLCCVRPNSLGCWWLFNWIHQVGPTFIHRTRIAI